MGGGKQRNKFILQVLVVCMVFAAIPLLSQELVESDAIRPFVEAYGPFAIVALSFISGFNLLVPVPAASFSPVFLAVGFSFSAIVLLMTIGMVLADNVAYYIGWAGRHFLSPTQERMFLRFARLEQKRSWAVPLAVFLFAAFVPVPNEVIVIPLGVLGYRLRFLLPALILGSTAFNIIVSYGVLNIFELFVIRA